MSGPPALPEAEQPGGASLPANLEPLVETARAYARAATSQKHQPRLRRRLARLSALARPPGPRPQAARRPRMRRPLSARRSRPAPRAQAAKARTVATIERRLSALVWNFAQRALPFDRKDRHVATVLAGVRRTHGQPPVQKEALLPEHVLAMLDLLPPSSLRNLRDRAILLLGFAGGLRRSEIAGLVMSPEDSLQGSGWPEFFDDGVLLTLRGKTGWREVEIGRGSKDATCPVAALKAWLKFARIARGPLFRAVVGREVGSESLNDRHVARLIKRLAVAAGVRGDLSERDREEKFSGHSLRAGLASSAEIDERYVQKHLGHASAEMTRRYQRRRDRFRVNLTKAAGL